MCLIFLLSFILLDWNKYPVRWLTEIYSNWRLFHLPSREQPSSCHSTAKCMTATVLHALDFPSGSAVKIPPANAGDSGLIPCLGRSLGGGNGDLLYIPHWYKTMDRGAWQATIHKVVKSQTRLSTHTQIYPWNLQTHRSAALPQIWIFNHLLKTFCSMSCSQPNGL